MLLGYDAFSWLQNPEHTLLSVRGAMELFQSPEQVEGLVGGLGPATMVLAWPSWAVLGVIGLILALLFRRRD